MEKEKKEVKKSVKTKKTKNKKLPKDISQKILKTVQKNIIIAISIMVYFFILNLAYSKMRDYRLVEDLKIFAGTFLIVGIFFLEKAYKNDSGESAIYGIEMLVLSGHTLSIMHVINFYNYNFQFYLLTSSYVFGIYYVLKAIIIYTRGKKQYLSKYSDISEIVKNEPQKKEAKKRKKI